MANERLEHAFKWLGEEIVKLRNPDQEFAPAQRVHDGFQAIEEVLQALAMEVRDLKNSQEGISPS